MPPSTAATAGRVCAVVVTFNRLALLEACIESLRRQTRPPDAILVVNNGSTDGTAEWLRGHADLLVTTQPNLGSAGGCDAGMRRARAEGFAWAWMLDDDLVVPPDALKTLLDDARRGSLDLVNPLVAADTEPETLAFGLAPGIQTVAEAKDAARDGLIRDLVNPWNGLLVSRATMDRIGFVKVEMFISGDEIEYVHRAKANGLAMATSTAVVCHHPKPRFAYQPILFNRFRVEVPNGPRRWIYLRNIGYINSRYYGVKAVLRDLFKFGWFFLTHGKAEHGGIGKFLRYYLDGITDRYVLEPARDAEAAAAYPGR